MSAMWREAYHTKNTTEGDTWRAGPLPPRPLSCRVEIRHQPDVRLLVEHRARKSSPVTRHRHESESALGRQPGHQFLAAAVGTHTPDRGWICWSEHSVRSVAIIEEVDPAVAAPQQRHIVAGRPAHAGPRHMPYTRAPEPKPLLRAMHRGGEHHAPIGREHGAEERSDRVASRNDAFGTLRDVQRNERSPFPGRIQQQPSIR